MISHLFFDTVLLSFIASVTYVLLKLLVWFGGSWPYQRWYYRCAIAVMLMFVLPLYKLREIISALSPEIVTSVDDMIGVTFPGIFHVSTPIGGETRIQLLTDGLVISWDRIARWGSIVWFLAACGLLLWNVCCLARFCHRVKQFPAVENDLLERLVEKQSCNLGIKTKVRLVEFPGNQSPMLVGFFYPTILLPAKHLTIGEAQLILTHELIHLRRGDVWKVFLVNFIQAVHWFNPFAYLLKRDFIYWMETSCDEEIAMLLNFSQRKMYARLLLECSNSSRHMAHELSISFVSYREKLERRITTMLNINKKANRLVCLILSIVMAVGCVSVSVFAAEKTGSSATDGGRLFQEEPVGAESSSVIISSDAVTAQNGKIPPVYTPAGEKPYSAGSESGAAVGSEIAAINTDYDECVKVAVLSPIDENTYEVLDDDGNVMAILAERSSDDAVTPRAGWNINWTVRSGVTTVGDNRYASYDGLAFDFDIDFSRTGTSWIGLRLVDERTTWLVMDSTDGFHGTITCKDDYGTVALAIKNSSSNTITYSGTYYI